MVVKRKRRRSWSGVGSAVRHEGVAAVGGVIWGVMVLAGLASLYHLAYQVSVTVEEVVSNHSVCLLKCGKPDV